MKLLSGQLWKWYTINQFLSVQFLCERNSRIYCHCQYIFLKKDTKVNVNIHVYKERNCHYGNTQWISRRHHRNDAFRLHVTALFTYVNDDVIVLFTSIKNVIMATLSEFPVVIITHR